MGILKPILFLNNLRIDILQDLRLDLGLGDVGDSLLFVVELLPGRFALLLGQVLVDLVLQQGESCRGI